jgi:hypothetical protein
MLPRLRAGEMTADEQPLCPDAGEGANGSHEGTPDPPDLDPPPPRRLEAASREFLVSVREEIGAVEAQLAATERQIERLRAERDRLRRSLADWRQIEVSVAKLAGEGHPPDPEPAGSDPDPDPAPPPKPPRAASTTAVVREVVADILRRTGHPMTIKEILAAVEASGFRFPLASNHYHVVDQALRNGGRYRRDAGMRWWFNEVADDV